MHLCIPAHTIAIHFHHKSPQPGCNIQSICGPRMSLNSNLEILLFRCADGEEKQGRGIKKKKNHRMNRANVCELICGSNRQVHKAYKSLFSTAACHRWQRWLRFIPDDDHNETSLSFMGAFLTTSCAMKRLTAAWQTRQPTAFGSIPSTSRFRAREAAATKEERRTLFLHYRCRRSHHNKGSYKNLIQRLSRLARRLNNRRAEGWVQHGSEFINCHNERLRRLSRSMNSQSKVKSGPSVFYILAVTWNPHPALNFPVKYTTFHVTHTNPAAIFLSLNRAESLYLNSPHRVRCSCSWDSSYWLAEPKGEATELCLSLALSRAWPRPPLLYSTLLWSSLFYFKQGSIWLYCTLLDCQGGLKQPQACSTSQQTQVTRSIERALIPNTYTDTSTQTESVNNTQTPALQLCLLTAARPPQSSSEVKICYIMQPSIDFPPLAPCQLPAPKSKI